MITSDDLGRINKVEIKNDSGSNIMSKEYAYKNIGTENGVNTTTNLVETETIGSLIKNYTYYSNGNIDTITIGNKVIDYDYDFIGQLVREVVKVAGVETRRVDYVYDTGGNILNKTLTESGQSPVTVSYGYDSVWKDKLVSFDGKSLTYDQIGNPLTIGDSVLTWIQGRKLSTFKKDATLD